MECEESVVLVALSSSDPGLQYLADTFNLPKSPHMVSLALAGKTVKNTRKESPDNVASGPKECLKRCFSSY